MDRNHSRSASSRPRTSGESRAGSAREPEPRAHGRILAVVAEQALSVAVEELAVEVEIQVAEEELPQRIAEVELDRALAGGAHAVIGLEFHAVGLADVQLQIDVAAELLDVGIVRIVAHVEPGTRDYRQVDLLEVSG